MTAGSGLAPFRDPTDPAGVSPNLITGAVTRPEGSRRPPTFQSSRQDDHHLYQQQRRHQPQLDSLPSISSITHPPFQPTTLSYLPPTLSSIAPPPLHMVSQAPPSHPQQMPMAPPVPQPGYHHPPPPPAQSMMPQAPNAAYHQAPPPPPPFGPEYDQGYGRMPLPAGARMNVQRGSGKEIKRRTKTGCLTCRKRRIKCDEAHPHCKNCVKSKRECAGYDPMFKPHGQGNQIIRPASSAAAAPALHPPQSYPVGPPSSATPSASSGPSNAAPQMLSQPAAIDPSLQQHHAPPPMPQDKYGAGIDDPGFVKLIASPTRMEDLINIGSGQEPPKWQRSEPITEAERAHAEGLYINIFGYGLDSFFETRWFGKRGWAHLVNDSKLLEKIVLLHSRLSIGPGLPEWERSLSLEGHIIWELILLCRHVSTSIKTTNATDAAHDLETDSNVHDAAARTQVLESLITNQQLDTADVVPATPDQRPDSTDLATPEKAKERLNRMQAFWHSLSKFCSLNVPELSEEEKKDSSIMTSTSTPEIDACLASMRGLLDQHEPRDILYSVAIARHLLRPSTVNALRPARTNDESDPATQIHIARSFLYQETRMGTSPLMTRVARMVIRSWTPVSIS